MQRSMVNISVAYHCLVGERRLDIVDCQTPAQFRDFLWAAQIPSFFPDHVEGKRYMGRRWSSSAKLHTARS